MLALWRINICLYSVFFVLAVDNQWQIVYIYTMLVYISRCVLSIAGLLAIVYDKWTHAHSKNISEVCRLFSRLHIFKRFCLQIVQYTNTKSQNVKLHKMIFLRFSGFFFLIAFNLQLVFYHFLRIKDQNNNPQTFWRRFYSRLLKKLVNFPNVFTAFPNFLFCFLSPVNVFFVLSNYKKQPFRIKN